MQRRKIISIYLENFLTCYDEDDRSDIIASIGRVRLQILRQSDSKNCRYLLELSGAI